MSAPRVIKRTPDLGLKIRLQPVAETAGVAAPGGCPCNATGVVWLVRPTYVYESNEWGESAWWSAPDMSTMEAVGIEESGGLVPNVTPGPDTFISTQAVYYYEGYPQPPANVFAAAAVGPEVRGVQWDVERVGGDQFSIDVDTSGPVAWVTINPVNISGLAAGYTTITLTARCEDSVVGALRLQVRHEGF